MFTFSKYVLFSTCNLSKINFVMKESVPLFYPAAHVED